MHVQAKAFAGSKGKGERYRKTVFLIAIYILIKKGLFKPRILHLRAFDLENLFQIQKILKSGKLNCT